jgi:hypothetical protein
MAKIPYHHLHPNEAVRYVVEITRPAVPIDCILENQANFLLLS